jgi:hypothetical protein
MMLPKSTRCFLPNAGACMLNVCYCYVHRVCGGGVKSCASRVGLQACKGSKGSFAVGWCSARIDGGTMI